jgi:predicted DCC family thiol-disulfide oxidoreductase YuxK
MMPTDISRDPNAWIVLYDRDCGFCRWSLAQLLALDRERRLRPLALATEEADRLLADLTPEERAASWHLVSPSGMRWSAGAAAPPLLRLLPAGRLPAALLDQAPLLTERVYRWVADHRSTFSHLIPERAKRHADRRVAQAESRPAMGPRLTQAARSAGSFASR